MLEDLDHLSTRIAQLVQLAQDVRAENSALRTELGRRDAHIQKLRDTLEVAQIRVEDVLARLPGKPPEPEADAEDGIPADHVGGAEVAPDDDDTHQPQPGDAEPGARSAIYGTP